MGKDIYRYKAIRANGTVGYSCVTAHLNQDYVLNEICKMFDGTKERVKIYCNGSLICTINYYKAKKNDKILNKSTGDVYPSLKAFCEEFKISEAFAYHIIKHKNTYEWIKS